MLKNYLKTALGTLTKNQSYSVINIVGLAVSLCAAILILLWVWDELSYDQMDLGYDKENVLTFRRHNFENLDAIKAELSSQPGILAVSASSERVENAWSMTSFWSARENPIKAIRTE